MTTTPGPTRALADVGLSPDQLDTTEPPAEGCGQCTLSVPHYHAKPMTGPAFAAPSEPPAETQQDDDHEPYADAYEWEPVAARPSADTDKLRRVREAADLLTRDADESSDVIARLAYRDAANRIRAALDAR